MREKCCWLLPGCPLILCHLVELAASKTPQIRTPGTQLMHTIEHCCVQPRAPPVDAGLGVLLRLRADTATDSTARRHSRAEDAAQQYAETTSTRSGHLRLRRHLDRSARRTAPMRNCQTGGRAVGTAARPARGHCGSSSASKTSERGAARTGGRHRPKRRTDQQSHVGGLAHARRGGLGGGSGWRANTITERREWGPGALRAAGRVHAPRLSGGPLEPAEPALRLSVPRLRTRSASEKDFTTPARRRCDGVRTTHSHSYKHRNTNGTAPSRAGRRRSP